MNPSVVQTLAASDEILSRVIENVGTVEVVTTGDVFHDLMSCLIEQQIHYRSTKRIFQKMLDRTAFHILTPDNFDEFAKQTFAGVKLSEQKYETIAQTVEFWGTHTVDWTTETDDSVRRILGQIKGIGTWTQDMILMYTLQRPDIFPFDDFHVKEIMTFLYGLDPKSRLKAQMLDVARAWSPHSSVAVRYLLEWKKMRK